MDPVWWERWNQWTLSELPVLNRAVIRGRRPARDLVAQARAEVLADLPDAGEYMPREARRVLVLLGLLGASAARHHQEADVARKAKPQESFGGLEVGATGVPFLSYFAAVAEASGTGHPGRDCYASIVRWNVPTAEVLVGSETVALLPGVFPDGRIRTYTGDPGELAFLELLKTSEVLELAANDALEPIADGSCDVRSAEAAERAWAATRFLAALATANQGFAALAPDHGGLGTEHFMDVFRQFAVHWQPDDIPPSGAQDAQFLRRDLLLGIDFPGYHHHMRRNFPALLDEERAGLDRQAARPTLPATLMRALDLAPAELATATREQLRDLVREHPDLAAWYSLLAANAKVGGVHLMLTEKYLFKPQRARDEAGVGDSPLVSNRRGTSGMEEPLLVRLTRARRNHPLRMFAMLPADELSRGARAGHADGVPTVRYRAGGD
ncbi:hypothetical protein ABIA31_002643 [Catenulispora sp. MAP5-51]|uniref:hypothetical protein n=1 Tax=Catenulispora sp. MAP5-51 TaxID=3156298 RepID=UPI003515DBB8